MSKKEFSQLNELLPKVVNQYNLQRQVTGAVICHQFRKAATAIWHEGIEECIQPQSYSDGVLTIVVVDAGWAQQVQFKQVDILKRLKAASPGQSIKQLQTRVSSDGFDKN
ncbi:MAG: DUF721 domain-containing protein [Candidatus Peregrinibacteria bacterium]|nr:DUF721 domain-containing protein [Candidatus Peregrinibacteria bacterium]